MTVLRPKLLVFISMMYVSVISAESSDVNSAKKIKIYDDPVYSGPVYSSSRVASYRVEPHDIGVDGYKKGRISRIKLALCDRCRYRVYSLSNELKAELFNEDINRDELLRALLFKKYTRASVEIDRHRRLITGIRLGL